MYSGQLFLPAGLLCRARGQRHGCSDLPAAETPVVRRALMPQAGSVSGGFLSWRCAEVGVRAAPCTHSSLTHMLMQQKEKEK